MAIVNAVSRPIAAALVSVTLLSFVLTAKVFAQAGSTGGTIGKTDKSQSGMQGEPSFRPEPNARKPAKQAGVPRNITASSCSKMPGNWSWFNGSVVIRPDGTATGGRVTATWSCTNDFVVMHWSHGYTDRLTLSRDGTHLEGTNGFITVTGDRR
jgi:hypothetical protein